MSDYQGEKFKMFLKSRNISVIKAAEMLGVTRNTVYTYFGSTNLTRETVSGIITTFDTDEQEVFGINNKKKHNEARILGEIAYPIEPGESPFIDLGEGKYIMIVPLVNEYAYGGYLGGYKDPEYLEELPKHTIIVDKHHKGTYRAFEVVGDSMDDGTINSIPDGAIVTGRDIQQHLWSSKFHTHRFKDYVIVHKTRGVIVKRITHHDTETGIITCHSLNPNKSDYADYDVHLDDVKQMFNVVNVLLKR